MTDQGCQRERARAVVQTLPYSQMPKKMAVGLVQYIVYWLNNIPKHGQDYSPRDLILGEQKFDYKTVCCIPFGAYAQVHDDLRITNTMEARTTGAINMGLTRNLQGTHRFYSLKSGDIIVRRNWTEMPMPSEAIDKLLELLEKEVDWEGGEPLNGNNDPQDSKRPEELEEIRDEQGIIEGQMSDQGSDQEERKADNENQESIVVESHNAEGQENMNADTKVENVMTRTESSSTHGYNNNNNSWITKISARSAFMSPTG